MTPGRCDLFCASHRGTEPRVPRSLGYSGGGAPAGVAQLVERQPSKLHVASSNLVSRSNPSIRSECVMDDDRVEFEEWNAYRLDRRSGDADPDDELEVDEEAADPEEAAPARTRAPGVIARLLRRS